jgi:RNA polymerase sigma-70 factor, ECF subfamily
VLDPLAEAALRVRAGDAAAFQVIVNTTGNALVRLSARMLGSLADAEDVVQEAYIKAYRSLATGQFDGRSSVKTWLYRIVTHASIDAMRSRSRRPPVADTASEPSYDGQALAEAHVALTELSDLLGELPPDQRAALVLKSVEGFTAPEIAELMGSTEGAVEQLLVRGRATLRQKGRGS